MVFIPPAASKLSSCVGIVCALRKMSIERMKSKSIMRYWKTSVFTTALNPAVYTYKIIVPPTRTTAAV